MGRINKKERGELLYLSYLGRKKLYNLQEEGIQEWGFYPR